MVRTRETGECEMVRSFGPCKPWCHCQRFVQPWQGRYLCQVPEYRNRRWRNKSSNHHEQIRGSGEIVQVRSILQFPVPSLSSVDWISLELTLIRPFRSIPYDLVQTKETYGTSIQNISSQIRLVCIGESEGSALACTQMAWVSTNHRTGIAMAVTVCIGCRALISMCQASLSVPNKKKRFWTDWRRTHPISFWNFR